MTTSPGYSLIASRADFHAALRAAFAEAASVGCREIWISDTDFADWPLNEVAVVESLTQWAQSHRKLTVLAQTFDEIARRHGRWIEWRRLWNHVVECRANVELEAGEMPTMLLAPGLLTLRLVDPVRYRGSVSHQAADAIAAKELFDAVLQRSAEAFPVTTLGL
jgi:peptidyl-tRNA hydrolase